MFKPRMILGGLDESIVQSNNIKVIEDSVINEEQVFTKEEVLELIQQVAIKEGFKADQLEISEEIRDKNGNLIILSVDVTKGRSLGEGRKGIQYSYMIKGDHGKEGSSMISFILRTYKGGEPSDTEMGEVAAYENGAWDINPGNILEKVKMN